MLAGARQEHWSGQGGGLDFFDAKGVAELVGSAYGVDADRGTDRSVFLVRPRSRRRRHLHRDGQRIVVGAIGQLQRQLVADRGLSSTDAVFGGELDLGALDRAAGQPATSRITPLPRFPSIVRDLSILIDERLPAAQVRGTIRANAPKTLVSVREFDRYQGAGVPPVRSVCRFASRSAIPTGR